MNRIEVEQQQQPTGSEFHFSLSSRHEGTQILSSHDRIYSIAFSRSITCISEMRFLKRESVALLSRNILVRITAHVLRKGQKRMRKNVTKGLHRFHYKENENKKPGSQVLCVSKINTTSSTNIS